MTNKIRCVILFSCMLSFSLVTRAQLSINGASFTIETGATVTVQGNLSSNVDIGGAGTILMKGTAIQTINMNGFTIPKLAIENAANVSLGSDAKISNSLLFTTGKIQLGTSNLILADAATVSGQGTGKFVETNGTGQLRKTLSSNKVNYEMPVGFGTSYQPAFIFSTGTYTAAYVGVQVKGTAHPNKNPRTTEFLNEYWPITQSGISGTLRVTGKYFSNFTLTGGTEADLRGIIYTNNDWDIGNGRIDNTADTAGSLIPAAGADLYAMNRFVLLKNKVFLQGCYDPATGLMNDKLRTLASFPTTDPYRSAPYNTYFTHLLNTTPETITSPATVLGAQANTNDNIVDWVFIEVHNAANTIKETRSALLQKDGDVVDVDGVSPVYFKNVDAGGYTVLVRHRNHLGMSTNPATFLPVLNEKAPAITVDLTSASATQLFGTAVTNYAVATNGKTLLYAGNVSGNGFVRYQGNNGPGTTNISDRIALLGDIGNNEATVLTTYQRGDVNMNGFTRYQGNNGPGTFNVSDRIFLLGTVLGNSEVQIRTQLLPN